VQGGASGAGYSFAVNDYTGANILTVFKDAPGIPSSGQVLIGGGDIKAAGGITCVGVTSTGVVSATAFAAQSSAPSLVIERTNSVNACAIYLRDTSATRYNWLAGVQYNVDNGYEITPSTTVGGSTYSTTAFRASFDGSSVKIGFLGATAVARATMAAATGTATRTSFATGSVTLPALAAAVKAIIDDLRAYGLQG
jgi:hypothetical protein